MALADRWLLPDGMKELLPPVAREVELVRRRVLDLYDSWGYELVMPPVAEHLESLLTGVGRDLGLQTFKVTDEMSGHMLGIRADITPQVARIDAHRLRTDGVSRLCYCGAVLHTRPVNMLASRNPMQLGAELFGHEGLDSDAEVISLMLETLLATGVQGQVTLDLGHVGVFAELVRAAALTAEQTDAYIDILQRKALPEIAPFVASLGLHAELAGHFHALAALNGNEGVLTKAEQLFVGQEKILAAITHLRQVADMVISRYPEVRLYFDLGELRGYRYHTGIVFAAYSPRFGQALAKGGRYDQIGADFGRARAATGFSTDLKTLVMLGLEAQPVARAAVMAPSNTDADLIDTIKQLRAHGERVVTQLAGSKVPDICDRQLVKKGTEWVLEAL